MIGQVIPAAPLVSANDPGLRFASSGLLARPTNGSDCGSLRDHEL